MEAMITAVVAAHVGGFTHMAVYAGVARANVVVFTDSEVLGVGGRVDDDGTTNAPVGSAGVAGHAQGVVGEWQLELIAMWVMAV